MCRGAARGARRARPPGLLSIPAPGAKPWGGAVAARLGDRAGCGGGRAPGRRTIGPVAATGRPGADGRRRTRCVLW
ncbi:hypothetical protein ATKI12_3862 [Kitasatospora sp. Ki12]